MPDHLSAKNNFPLCYTNIVSLILRNLPETSLTYLVTSIFIADWVLLFIKKLYDICIKRPKFLPSISTNWYVFIPIFPTILHFW